MTDQAPAPPPSPNTQTHFSWLRTRLSIERTLMSWVRTAASLIAFGFTIFQFFERVDQMTGVHVPRRPGLIRVISLSLIGIGTLALLVAMSEYRSAIGYLWSDAYRPFAGMGAERPRRTPVGAVALLLALVGIVAFGALFVRTVAGTSGVH